MTEDHISSNVHIRSEIIGDNIPVFCKKIPTVTHRYGLDLHINDLSNPEDSLWLNALIWPEHTERRVLFHQSLDCLMKNMDELNLIEGDGIELLPNIIEQIPDNSTICIFHTHVANQITADLKHRLLDTIKVIGSNREVFHIYNNIWDKYLHIDYFLNSVEHHKLAAETDGHGRWFKWML